MTQEIQYVIDAYGELLYTASMSHPLTLLEMISDEKSIVRTAPPATGEHYWRFQAGEIPGAWVEKSARTNPHQEWDSANRAWRDPRTLARIKADQWAKIKAERNQRISTPKQTSIGLMDADEASQNNLNKVIALVTLAVAKGLPGVANFTLATNVRVSLTLDQLQTAALEMGAQVQTLYDMADVLRRQIDACTTQSAVEATTWPS